MSIKNSFDNGLQVLKAIYPENIVEEAVYELWDLYSLCSQTEDWVAIAELKWEHRLTDNEAIFLWNLKQKVYNG